MVYCALCSESSDMQSILDRVGPSLEPRTGPDTSLDFRHMRSAFTRKTSKRMKMTLGMQFHSLMIILIASYHAMLADAGLSFMQIASLKEEKSFLPQPLPS